MSTQRAIEGHRCFAWRTLLMVGLLCNFGTVTAADVVTYYHTDGLGTPVMESDAGGQVTYSREHRPYGAQALGAAKHGPGFTGHVGDADSGLIYMQARYYDPMAGRFLSNDPVPSMLGNGSNYNRYWYANNNPYAFVDPDGRQAKSGSQKTPDNCGDQPCPEPPKQEEPKPEPIPTIDWSRIKVSRDGAPGSLEDKQKVTDLLNKMQADGQVNFQESASGVVLIFNIISNPTGATVGGQVPAIGSSSREATINFNPSYGLQIGSLRQPPVLALFHELMHVYDRFYNGMAPQFIGDSSRDNAFVIPRERMYARKLGVVSRGAHDQGRLVFYGD